MNLLRRMERYMRRSGTPPTRLGREAAGDPRLVGDLRKGREMRPETAARLAHWLDRADGRLEGGRWNG